MLVLLLQTAPSTPATRRFPIVEARKSAEKRQPGHTPTTQLPTTRSQVQTSVATAPKPGQPSFQPSKCIVIFRINPNKECNYRPKMTWYTGSQWHDQGCYSRRIQETFAASDFTDSGGVDYFIKKFREVA